MRRKRWALLVVLVLVLLVGGTLAVGGYLLSRWWATSVPGPPPAIVVETAYPGANAETVATVVAVPIEQQVNGVESMRYLLSRCGDDGSYALTVAFRPGVDLDQAQVLVQNRVNLALPALPDLVQRNGVAVKKGPAGVLLLLALSSPDGSRDMLFLGRYATQVRDELARVPGIADVVCLGQRGAQAAPRLDGKPVVLLCVHLLPGAKPRQTSEALAGRLSVVRAQMPGGVDLQTAFDFTESWTSGGWSAPDCLLVDVDFPLGASPQRVAHGLQQCADRVRDVEGVRSVLALPEGPFDRARDRACLLVRLPPAGREEISRRIREIGEEMPDVVLRVRDLAGASGRYPVHLAVCGPEADRVRELADALVRRLSQAAQLTDMWVSRDGTPRPRLDVRLDREKLNALGLRPGEVLDLLAPFGEPGPDRMEELRALQVPLPGGKRISLAALAAVRQVEAPAAITRIDLQPGVEITANTAAGLSFAQARALCEREADSAREELGLPATYRLTWLR